MHNIGLKLWSRNIQYIRPAQKLYDEKYYSYIELFAEPESYSMQIKYWQELKIPFIIHGPHYAAGVNFADSEKEAHNRAAVEEALRYADALHSSIVIFHPGVGGTPEETIRQVKSIGDKRMVMENKPALGLGGEVCRGASKEEITELLSETGLRFCLDIGHAICAANTYKVFPLDYVRELITLQPAVFHLTDGDIFSERDGHQHYGHGNYPFKEIIRLIPEGAMITNEAKKDSPHTLVDFCADIDFFRRLSL